MGERRKITDSVSVEEMLNMREKERLINSEIARRLDISPITVTKYIGQTPKDLLKQFQSERAKKNMDKIKSGTKNYHSSKKSTPKVDKQKYTPPYSAKDWQESTTIHKLNGFYANYEVNYTASEVEITFLDGYSVGKLAKADLMKLIDEFSRVANILEK